MCVYNSVILWRHRADTKSLPREVGGPSGMRGRQSD